MGVGLCVQRRRGVPCDRLLRLHRPPLGPVLWRCHPRLQRPPQGLACNSCRFQVPQFTLRQWDCPAATLSAATPAITKWAPSIDSALPTLVPCLSSFFGLQDCSDAICLRTGKAGVIGRHGDPNSSETQARSNGAQAVVACALNDSAIEGAPGGHPDGG